MAGNNRMRDPYTVLGVSRSADLTEIKAAWRTMAKKLHPDQNRGDPNAQSRFTEVGRAYDLLKDPDKRRRYDEMLNRAEPSPAVELQRRFVHEYFDALGRGGTMLMRTAVQAAEHSMARETRAPGSQDGTTAGTAHEGGAGAPPKCGNNGRRRSRHRSRTVG